MLNASRAILNDIAAKVIKMRLYSYVVARDFGFAPNPFYNTCTLATCKPIIRRTARIGDWVLGTGTAAEKKAGYLVYIMRVSEIMTFDEYWQSERFQKKKPNLTSSKKKAFGDNIYFRDPVNGNWHQANSHHSLSDGSPNVTNIATDTSADRVLISEEYTYWGRSGPKIPDQYRNFDGVDICAHRGHKCNFTSDHKNEFLAWVNSLGQNGYLGEPQAWKRTP